MNTQIPTPDNANPKEEKVLLVIEHNKLISFYQEGKYEEACQFIIDTLKHFEKTLYITISQDIQHVINGFISSLFYILVQEKFRIPNKYSVAMITTSHLLANVIAMSAYRTADSIIQHLMNQEGNLVKLLMVYTCQTKAVLDPAKLFDAQPILASSWWQNYQTAPAGSLTEEMHKNMTGQLITPPKNFTLINALTSPLYFQSTYFTSNAKERPIKEMFNRELQKLVKNQRPIKSYPEKKKIALISGRWQPTTAVYKSLYPMIAELAKTYDITLIQFGENEDQIEKSAFKRVKKVTLKEDNKTMDLRSIELNGFQLAYFADIGMNSESPYLSNVQVAPIMVTAYGHPVSTFGSKIDYFIGGQEVEDASLAEQNYSERLVLMPGIASIPVDPKYKRNNKPKKEFIINCCWTAAKINYPMLSMLREIHTRANISVKFAFYPSWTVGRYNNAVPLQRLMHDILPGCIEIHLDKKYHEYLELLERGSFSLDSYPFGGYNTVVDNMFVGLPVVAIEGGQFYNRAASALLRRVGLDKCITQNTNQCLETALQLINNPEILEERVKHVESLDVLRTKLLEAPEPKGFVRTIDYLIENHDRLKAENSKSPIIIN